MGRTREDDQHAHPGDMRSSGVCRKKLAAALGSKDSSRICVYCSPFSRTVETAVIAAKHLGITETDANFQVHNLVSTA